MLEEFTTIKEKVQGEVTEKKSRFIANLFPIESEKEAMERLQEIKKQYRDAKHHVFAYRIADEKERASDDGEPSGTAGVPILSILRGMNLQNVMVIVTRYFGGILLGTGGLVKAYGDATKIALEKCSLCEKIRKANFLVELPYSYYDKLQYFCRANQFAMVDSNFCSTVSVHILVKHGDFAFFENRIKDLSDGTATVIQGESRYYDK